MSRSAVGSVADGLEIDAVRVDDERAVIARMIVRTDAGRAVVPDGGRVKAST